MLAEYSKDLPTYLQYCKDVVFAGSESLFVDDHEEQKLIEQLWNYYQNGKVMTIKLKSCVRRYCKNII